MRKITVEITYDDPEDPEAFGDSFNAAMVWGALCRAFPYSSGAHWTVQQLDADNRSTITVGEPVGG